MIAEAIAKGLSLESKIGQTAAKIVAKVESQASEVERAAGEIETLYHGTTSSRAASIVGSNLKVGRGFRIAETFLAEDFTTAKAFARQKAADTLVKTGGLFPKTTVIVFEVPQELAQDLKVAFQDRAIIGEARGLTFPGIPGSSGYERILKSEFVTSFNEAIKKGEIKVTHFPQS